MALQVVTRTQYSFVANNKKISCLLTLNVKAIDNPSPVNIVGIVILGQNKKSHAKNTQLTRVNIVVGTDDPENIARGGAGDPYEPLRSNELQNKQFVRNMKTLGISFTTHPVIQISNIENATGTPGIYRIFWAALTCANIPITLFYSGEPSLTFPLLTCQCGTESHHENGVISTFVQVPDRYVKRAVVILKGLNLAPLDETTLCINRLNVGNVCSTCQHKQRNMTKSRHKRRANQDWKLGHHNINTS